MEDLKQQEIKLENLEYGFFFLSKKVLHGAKNKQKKTVMKKNVLLVA